MYVSSSVVFNSLQPHGLYVAHEAPLLVGFSRQEYWHQQPFPSPGYLPDPGVKPRSTALKVEPTGIYGRHTIKAGLAKLNVIAGLTELNWEIFMHTINI